MKEFPYINILYLNPLPMKTLALSFVLTLTLSSLAAQKPPIKFGEVSKEEILMTTYDKDTSASAVILGDYGVSSIIYRPSIGFSLDFERTIRIKILTKDGLDQGNLTIPLYKRGADNEKLSTLKAVTYNIEGGKIVESKLKNDGIFREVVDENWDHMKVTCPNVKEGSVVEITYKVNSPFLTNFQDWYFQSTIPVVVSEYRAVIPEYFNYSKFMQGYVVLSVNDEERVSTKIRFTSIERTTTRFAVQSQATNNEIDLMESRYRWVATDVPAFKPEPFMTAIHDYISKINFELEYVKFPNQPIEPFLGNWQDINKTMVEHEHFGKQITGNGFLKKIVDEVTAGLNSPTEKVAAIAGFVKQNVTWDGKQRFIGSESLRKILDEKKGTSADINLLLGSMLEKAGIKVQPVLISTRDHGLLRLGTPALSQFNYVICLAEIEDKFLLLDATEKLLPLSLLPERCLNGQGFAVSKEGFRWIPLETKIKTRSLTSADLRLNTSGELVGKVKVDCNGYAALKSRKKYIVDGEAEFLKQFVGAHQWEVKSTAITNANAIQENFVQEHELVVSENITVAGQTLYLDPFVLSGKRENPFKSEVREYPVDFGSPMEETFHLKLTLPEEYIVDELPQSKALLLPENAGRYIYNVSHHGNEIVITSIFHINKSLFAQVEYPDLREFYNQVVAKQTEQIVLKRKQ